MIALDPKRKLIQAPVIENWTLKSDPINSVLIRTSIIGFAFVIAAIGCAHPLTPRQIDNSTVYIHSTPIDDAPQIQRGRPRKVIDAIGWVWGIPSKILLWNRRVENHSICEETEYELTRYLETNQLYHTRVRLNQYRPGEDWRRLAKNKNVNPLIRFTFGSVSVLGETLLPGRVFGGDHYNPYTDTIHLYSDVPAIGLHEGGHAKDFARRKYKGLYSLGYLLPIAPLYYESNATADVFSYYEQHGTPEQHADAAKILYPAYGTYFGSAVGYAIPRYDLPIYYGSVIGGHALGRVEAKRIRDSTVEKDLQSSVSNPAPGESWIESRE